MSEKLEELNNAAKETAETALLSCCGSRRWANKMAEVRPFADVSVLLEQAEEIWQNLDAQDWLEAFAAHPKIGAKKAVPHQTVQSADWSKSEQSGTKNAAEVVRTELEEANRLYENKFGFIFIVCATGKSAEEMLSLCHNRLNNQDEHEIKIAADEQRKITEIRLKKLLEIE
ncbi:2-oxo-4-hydroxy-4-carboxy-5-ureidoimidazoline decarboxylase [soil metagenome]